MREHLALQEGELAHDVAGLEFFHRRTRNTSKAIRGTKSSY